MRLPLERQENVDEGGKRLNKRLILSVIQEVALAALMFGIPRNDIKLRALGSFSTSRRFGGAIDARELCVP